jgi:hypothetical protein
MAGGRRALTPLALVLLAVETTDLIFAVDSIPAVFAVTQNAFIVFTSNIFAILGLRSLYFVMAGAMGSFRYLRTGLACVLVVIGLKMLARALVASADEPVVGRGAGDRGGGHGLFHPGRPPREGTGQHARFAAMKFTWTVAEAQRELCRQLAGRWGFRPCSPNACSTAA